ncbi:DsbA family protein [Anaerosphaera multitolerans]|nr:DsbA family protein [Anaerosphaera multitolerans]
MKLYIFSDVVCPWSYGEEKVLRAIDYIYGEQVEQYNIMGGLIADYHDILPMNMKDKDSDEIANGILFQLWKAGYSIHKMPIMDKPPKLLSRENVSTYPLNISFVAARMSDETLANKYLRKLRESTILDGLNTMDDSIQLSIAEDVGIDGEIFLENLRDGASEEFLEDRISSFDRRFTNYPNFMYTDDKGREKLLTGYKSLEELISFLEEQKPNLVRREINLNKNEVYNFIKNYERVFFIELVELFKEETKLKEIIDELSIENKIKVKELEKGTELTLK